jgi:diacylglycerol kinase
MRQRIQAFKHALSGFKPLAKETHFRLHLIAAVLAVAFSVYLEINRIEWLFIAISITLVVVCEAINTAIEKLCDRVTKETDMAIKIVKDISAMMVLMASIFAAICGGVIWWDKI